MAVENIVESRGAHHPVTGRDAIEVPFFTDGRKPTGANDTETGPGYNHAESPAFDTGLERFFTASQLSVFTHEVMDSKDAEAYLVRWNFFLGKFMGNAFHVRALLEAAANAAPSSKSNTLDEEAISLIGEMDLLIKSALSFLRLNDEELNASWARDFVGIQLEQLNTVMTMLSLYPRIVTSFKREEERNGRRQTVIDTLARLMNPFDHIRSVETSNAHFSSLTIDIPTDGVDLFVAHPTGSDIDFAALAQNAASYMYLRSALDDIVYTAGRNRSRQTRLTIGYSGEKRRFLITDNTPVAQALMPYNGEPARSRLYAQVDRMGEGALMMMRPAVFNTTIGAIAIRISDNLVPPAPKPEAIEVDETGVIDFGEAEAVPGFAGIVEEDPGITAPTEEPGETNSTEVTPGEEAAGEEADCLASAITMAAEAAVNADAVQAAQLSATLCVGKPL